MRCAACSGTGETTGGMCSSCLGTGLVGLSRPQNAINTDLAARLATAERALEEAEKVIAPFAAISAPLASGWSLAMTELDKDALDAAARAIAGGGSLRDAIRAYLDVAHQDKKTSLDISGWMDECATEGCANKAMVLFERGGVGSHYCHACYMRIQAIPSPPKEG